MQAIVTIFPETPVHLPFSYYDKLSAAIYGAIRDADSSFAHDLHDGHDHKNRIKLFAFSPLHSKMTEVRRPAPEKNYEGELVFKGQTTFRLCSPWPELLNRLAEGLLTAQFLRIGSQLLHINRIELIAPPPFAETMKWQPVKTASIVTTWSDRETSTKRCILPDQKEGDQTTETLLQYNLHHKWQRLREVRPDIIQSWSAEDASVETDHIETRLLPFDANTLFKTKFHTIKGNPVKSWIAPVQIKAPLPIQRIAWSCGLGEMNSMGFGVVEECS
jgi:CRISPR-associated endoribonuclease Cas6